MINIILWALGLIFVFIIVTGWKKGGTLLWSFDNYDDKMPPTDMHLWEGKPDWLRWLLWRLRNPLHNFTWYVVGVVDRVKKVESPFEPYIQWHPNDGEWLKLTVVTYKDTRLPFRAWRNKEWEFYVGWRPKGCFSLPTLRRR